MSMHGLNFRSNVLLEALQTEDGGGLRKHLEPIDLPQGYKCATSGRSIEHAYFPIRGIVGRVAGGHSDRRVDAGIYGRDGFSGIPLVFGLEHSPHDDIVQVAGDAVRAPTAIIVELLRGDASFRGVLLHFAYCLSLQASFSALSNTLDDVRQRVARLLVMCLDRIDGHELALTHAFLASTLGVRRASVTSAIHDLEGDHVLKATRGRIEIKDRESLLAMAGTSYGTAEREYERLICDRAPALR